MQNPIANLSDPLSALAQLGDFADNPSMGMLLALGVAGVVVGRCAAKWLAPSDSERK